MKVVYDARYTRIDHPDGLTRYSANLMKALSKLADVTMLINDERQLALLPDLPWHKVNAPQSASELWVAAKVNKLKPDVVISPLQTMGSWLRKYPLILTCQDLIYYQFPSAPKELPTLARGIWFLYHQAFWPQRIMLNRPDLVATISRTTERLMRAHRFTKRPIRLVSNAASVDAGQRRHSDGSRTKELLYMGSFMPYKNVETIVRAAKDLPDYTIHLLSPISRPRRDELAALAGEGGAATNIVFHDGVSEEEYQELLKRVSASVTLSQAEGFGLPLIEAMQVGTPVIAADTEIFREVGADAVSYVPATDAAAFVSAVRALENDDEFQARSRAGLSRATHYSWEQSASALYEAAQEAIELYQAKL